MTTTCRSTWTIAKAMPTSLPTWSANCRSAAGFPTIAAPTSSTSPAARRSLTPAYQALQMLTSLELEIYPAL